MGRGVQVIQSRVMESSERASKMVPLAQEKVKEELLVAEEEEVDNDDTTATNNHLLGSVNDFEELPIEYQVNFNHILNFSFILLVPINLCAHHELSPRPAFLFQNSPELNFSSFTGERFTDVKKVYPIFES